MAFGRELDSNAMGPGLRANGDGIVALTIPARAEYIALCRLALTGLARTRALEERVEKLEQTSETERVR